MKTCATIVHSLSLPTLLYIQNVLKNAEFDILLLL